MDSAHVTSVAAKASIDSLRKRLKQGPLVKATSEDLNQVRGSLLQLKNTSRLIHEEAHVAKENVAALRKATDAAHLALQSVHYEKKHLEKELAQMLATEAYDSVEFSVPESAITMDRRVAMNDKLQRVKIEVTLRQSKHDQFVHKSFQVDG